MDFLKFAVLLACIVYASAQTAPVCETDSVCDIPDCKCSNTKVPGGLDPTTIPQLVVLTFDDAITTSNYNLYYQYLWDYKNLATGCNIGFTYFVPHEYTDYSLVHDLWQRGHEMASHSISHNTLQTYWQSLSYQGWVDEMAGQAQILSIYANIPVTDVVGDRAPQLQPGGNNQFHALADSQLKWDSTMPTNTYTNPPMWPYTLNYRSTQDCDIAPCPTDEIDGFWVFPLVDSKDINGTNCAMDDTCTAPGVNQPTYDFLKTNFLRHYNTNRAPFGVYIHAAWFQAHNETWPGYNQFIQDLTANYNDVYIVTMSDALKWIQNPTATADLAPDFFTCATKSTPCVPINCYYQNTPLGTGERYMMSCTPCPPTYPWIGNVYGS